VPLVTDAMLSSAGGSATALAIGGSGVTCADRLGCT
jgi:hypothetical protein